MGDADRSHIILRYKDPDTGKDAVWRLPIAWVYVDD